MVGVKDQLVQLVMLLSYYLRFLDVGSWYAVSRERMPSGANEQKKGLKAIPYKNIILIEKLEP